MLSAFRRCGRDLVELFNNTGWAFLIQVDYLPLASRKTGGERAQSYFRDKQDRPNIQRQGGQNEHFRHQSQAAVDCHA